MNPTVLAAQVNDIGVSVIAGRTAAIRQHVLEIPSPVVADAFSYHPATTARLAAQAGASFSQYAPWRPQAAATSRRTLMAAMPLAALRAAAGGILTLEAATGVIIAHRTWLDRGDFARFGPPRHRHIGDRLGSRHRRTGRWRPP